LDESGEADSREKILDLLADKMNTFPSQLTELPENSRMMITPLEDIGDVLDPSSHVRYVSMEDLLAVSTENDIKIYISNKLTGPCNAFNDRHFKALAEKSDDLFEWARLACEYFKATNKAGVEPMDRFEDVISGNVGI
jgi:hypothetical protein